MNIKRASDFVTALLGLTFLAPLFLLLILIVRRSMGSPVFFRQERPGLDCMLFTLYKFRTMQDSRDDTGNFLTDGERLTPVGRFLRKTSLDELPQLFNVLKGEMSLVGPRPLLMEYLELYSAEQKRRHAMKPGITGWAQINGRNAISWEEKFKLDVWYIDHWSLWLDVKILCATFYQTLFRKRISYVGHATMPKFKGSKGD